MPETGSTVDGSNIIAHSGSVGSPCEGNCFIYMNGQWDGYAAPNTRDRNFKIYGELIVEFPIQPQGGERYIEFLICNTCGAEIGQSELHCTRSPFEGLTCFCDKCGGRVYP